MRLERVWNNPALRLLPPIDVVTGFLDATARNEASGAAVAAALAYCTDTEYDPGNIEFARGAHLLLHEAWTVTKPVRGHSTAAQAAEIAAAADVARLLLVHLPPTRPAELLRDDARRVFEPSGLPGEGTTLPLGE